MIDRRKFLKGLGAIPLLSFINISEAEIIANNNYQLLETPECGILRVISDNEIKIVVVDMIQDFDINTNRWYIKPTMYKSNYYKCPSKGAVPESNRGHIVPIKSNSDIYIKYKNGWATKKYTMKGIPIAPLYV